MTSSLSQEKKIITNNY